MAADVYELILRRCLFLEKTHEILKTTKGDLSLNMHKM